MSNIEYRILRRSPSNVERQDATTPNSLRRGSRLLKPKNASEGTMLELRSLTAAEAAYAASKSPHAKRRLSAK